MKRNILILSLFILSLSLIGCGKEEPKSDELILGDANQSKIYNKTNKEDKEFNKVEEENNHASELANDLDLGISTPTPTPTPDVSTGNASNGGEGKLTPEEVDKMVIEEEFDCDVIKFGEKEFYVPITKGYQIAQYSENFAPEFGDGITTFSTNEKNTSILKIHIVPDTEYTDDYFWDFFDASYLELAKDNTIANLRMVDWKENEAYGYKINSKGIYYDTVKDAKITYTGWEIAWMKLGNIYVYAEYKTNDMEEEINIEEVATSMFPNFLYVNGLNE